MFMKHFPAPRTEPCQSPVSQNYSSQFRMKQCEKQRNLPQVSKLVAGRRGNEPPCLGFLGRTVFALHPAAPPGEEGTEGGEAGGGGVAGFMRVSVSSILNPFFSLVPGGAKGVTLKMAAGRRGGTEEGR